MNETAARLAALLGERKVLADDLADWGRDESGLIGAPPEAVVFAESVEDVSALLRFAAELRLPVTPVGARTGKAGGSIPARGGITLSLQRMDRVVEVRPADLLLVAQAGASTASVMAAAEEVSLFYPPDPNSWESCTIGGNVATNAGGPRALKYGVTGDYVLGLQAVLPDGTPIRTGTRTLKGVAGYDLTSLLVGSEGTLAVITEITLRLLPRPRQVHTALCIFESAGAAAGAVEAILSAGILPRTLELFDGPAIEAASRRGPYRFPAGAGAALLAETDGDEAEATLNQLLRLAEIAQASGAIDVLVAQTESQRRELWATRRIVSPALRDLHPRKVSDDVAVPRGRIAEYVERAAEVGREHGLLVSTYGHAGDGNLHANVLYDEESQRPLVESCLEALVKLALELGGTITGEHGVGLAKRDYLAWEQGAPLLELQRRLKALFDPLGILNPGKVLP